MIENLTRAEYLALLRQDFGTFAARCFHDLNPQAALATNGHLEVIAAKLTISIGLRRTGCGSPYRRTLHSRRRYRQFTTR